MAYQDSYVNTSNSAIMDRPVNLPPQYQKQYEAAARFPDESEILQSHEPMSNDQAVSIVRHDFEAASQYRTQNHDWRWDIADALYTGWKQAKFWEGTQIPRANVSVMVDFEQIESIMPRIMQGLFADPDWFEAVGLGNTTPKAARTIRNTIMSQLHDSNPRETCRRVAKSMVYYGNGILMVGWNYEVRKSLQFIPEFRPKMRRIQSPIDNTMMSVPSGSGFNRRVVERVVEDYINQPFIRYIPLRRFYIDPNAPSPIITESRYCAVESYVHIDDLYALHKCPGFEDMPDLYTLKLFAREKLITQADNSQSNQEAARRGGWSPQIDQSSDPSASRIKLITYFTKDRVIWSINNRYTCYNKPNPIGRITLHDAFYADLLDRFYAMAISDVVEPEQRVQEGLLNARLDELSLSLHPTTVKQRGSGTPAYQIRVRPGGVAESSDPKNDVIRQYPQNATQNAHLEAQASQIRAQKATGVSEMAVMGVGTTQNPAAKTATGANIQGGAAASRIIYTVENFECVVIEPTLVDIHDYDRRFLDPNQMIDAVSSDEADGKIDPIEVFGGKVRFEMRASSKMQSKQALMSLMPMTLQAMMNPQLLVQLNQLGQTIDFVEMMQMFMDASGYRKKFNWVRNLTDAEKKMLQQQKPDQNEADMMLQQDRLTRLKDMQTTKQEMDLLRDFLKMRYEALLFPEEPKKVGAGGGSE